MGVDEQGILPLLQKVEADMSAHVAPMRVRACALSMLEHTCVCTRMPVPCCGCIQQRAMSTNSPLIVSL